jgi:hypothetical protein
MEKYLGWIIDAKDIAGWFLGDGVVKLEANIYPDVEELYKFLLENNIVSTSFTGLMDYIQYGQYLSYNRIFRRSLSYEEEKDLIILNSIFEYRKLKIFKTTKSAHAILSISATGGSRTTARAMNKIKEWIRETLPNPRQDLINCLKDKGLISNDVNPFCEILSKDI